MEHKESADSHYPNIDQLKGVCTVQKVPFIIPGKALEVLPNGVEPVCSFQPLAQSEAILRNIAHIESAIELLDRGNSSHGPTGPIRKLAHIAQG